MRKHLKRLTLTLALLTSLFFASACENTSVVISDQCPGWVKPLSWSDQDTEGTFREIYRHNTEYEKNCGADER